MGLDIIDFNHYNSCSLGMKYLFIFLNLVFVGCVQQPVPVVVVPYLGQGSEVQINPLPHPFNLNGTMPYAVWVDGEKLNLTPKQTQDLTQSLNLEFKQPENTEAIHNGEGWLAPLDLENN